MKTLTIYWSRSGKNPCEIYVCETDPEAGAIEFPFYLLIVLHFPLHSTLTQTTTTRLPAREL